MRPYDVRLRLPAATHIGRSIWDGAFEVDVYNFLCRCLSPGMVAFDVGANLGLFTVVMAKLVGPTGGVHAFEPSVREAAEALHNLKINGLTNGFINPAAVTNYEGTARLALCDDEHGAFNALDRVWHPAAAGHVTKVLEVSATSLDAYVAAAGIHRVDLVKVDVEGAEVATLTGASEMLARYSPVLVCEFSAAAAGDQHCIELWQLGRSHGYRWYELDWRGHLSQEVAEATAPAYSNFVGVKGKWSGVADAEWEREWLCSRV